MFHKKGKADVGYVFQYKDQNSILPIYILLIYNI